MQYDAITVLKLKTEMLHIITGTFVDSSNQLQDLTEFGLNTELLLHKKNDDPIVTDHFTFVLKCLAQV